MPDQPDEQQSVVMEYVRKMHVKSMTIGFTAKRTLRMPSPTGDQFVSFASTESWEMGLEEGFTPEVAKVAAIHYSPDLFKKVFTDLLVAGVISTAEATALVKRAKASYLKALGITDETERDPINLQGVGEPVSSIGEESPERSGVSRGEDDRLPDSSGSSSGPPLNSESGPRSSEAGP